MFFLFQVFNPEPVMPAGMFDLPHGVGRMTEFSLIEQLGYHTHIFFQRVPAVDPETFRQTDCSIGFIDMCQRCDIELRFECWTAIAFQSAAAECPVCNHEKQRRPHEVLDGDCFSKRGSGVSRLQS